MLERVPGAVLVDRGRKTLKQSINRMECERFCLDERDFQCRSANFEIDTKDIGEQICLKAKILKALQFFL